MKEKLKKCETVFGAWTSIGDEQISEIFCRSGVDFVGIDMEHSTINQENARRIITSCHVNDVFCLARVASHNEEMIKRLMDSNIDGLIIPMVENGEQAEKIVSWCKYPPLGNRGYGIAKAQGYGFDFGHYIKEWNNKSIVIAQIESQKGVDNIHEILPHIDGIIIGPFDLSGSFGIPGQLGHPNVVKACQKVIDACKKTKKPCGTQLVESNKGNVKIALNDGYNFIILASDIFVLWKWSEKMRKIIKNG